ncbi:MAG: 50S ribosomal protein L30e [Candidatus Micrarchaeia archaeon]|jgi:large subunit ribosomal protein L30e
MADLARDIRLAVDTGKVALGYREVVKSISSSEAKAVVVAARGKKSMVDDIVHMCNVAGIKVIKFSEGSMELGLICGKPYSVNALAVIDQGHSNILNENY